MYNSGLFLLQSPQPCRSSPLPSCQGTVVDHFSKTGQSVGGFQGIPVFNMTSQDVFKNTTESEAFLTVQVTNTSSENYDNYSCDSFGF